MKAFVPDHWSRAIARTAEALKRYAPASVTLVDRPDEADLVVCHVVGRLDQVTREMAYGRRRGQQYALIQYVLRSTQKPTYDAWRPLWDQAAVVWSYLDLGEAFADSPAVFYRAPLGVDTATFRDLHLRRRYLALTHGTSWLSEGVREVVLAARTVRPEGTPVVHLGPHVRKASGVLAFDGVSDRELNLLYSQVDYVCPLRRTEGFELPAAEGLICGARPVLFDRPHYRHWYGDGLAEFIHEGSRAEVQEQLTQLFQSPVRRVTDEEKAIAAERFYWPTIVDGFWRRCLS